MVNSSHNEIELLEASIQGNTAAFESIVKKYQSFVCAITFSAIADVEKSEDMAQETFLHAWNNLSQLKDLQKFRSWLISIARNIISDSLRNQKRDLINKAAPIDQVEEKQISQIEPVQNALTKEQQAVVQNALMEIPEKYRVPLVLFYRHEKSIKLIAEQLDLSEELVKQHLSRGRKLLREQVVAMVESSISKTGPTKAFTSVVMVSIAGLVVKSSGAAAVAAGTAAGASAVVSSIAAKIAAVAAVIVIGISTVATYNHFTQPGESNQTPAITNPAENIAKTSDSEYFSPAVNMTIETAALQQSLQSEVASAMYSKNENLQITANNVQNASSNISSSNIAIALQNKPVSSPYEYFLFTRYTPQPSAKTLVLAHITDKGIELKDIVTEDFGKYRWGDPICVAAGKLYCGSYNYLYSIDLSTKETEQYPVRSRTLDYDFSLNTTTVFADNCLYGLARKGERITLRQLDFQRRAFRDIADVSKAQPSKDIAISPDRKCLAYFAMAPNGNYPSNRTEGHFLTIVDVESGKVTQPAKPIKFQVPLAASSFPGIPITWLDSENVVFIRSEIPEGETILSLNPSGVNMLSMVNVNTGRMEDITPIPGSLYGFSPELIQDNAGVGLLVQPQSDKQGSYRLDLKNRKLVENDLIAGNYRFVFGQLNYNEQDLGSAKSRYYKVSSDGKRIIWMSEQPAISNSAQNKESAVRAALSSDNGLLYYHDQEQDVPVAIAKVYNSAGLWIKAEDLQSRLPTTDSGKEWTPLSSLTQNVPTQQWVDTRKNIRDYLTCKIKTDKTAYLLHEPVQVTLTFTNKSNTDITINKPHVIETVMRPLIGLTIIYPEGQTSIHSGAQPYSPVDEEILLKAGESFVSTDTIEVSDIGNHSLEYKYEVPTMQQEFKGSIRTEPEVFNVVKVPDAAAERQLFEAKFARIMERFQEDIAKDPNWSGNNNISDKVIGLPGMGPAVAPYLIKAIDNETNKNPRSLLIRALSSIAGPQYIPYFKERLINGETESVCNWILKIYRENGSDKDTRQQALDALISGMSNKDVKIRREVCTYLTRIYDKSIETCFAKAVEDEDDKIRQDAGFYLAAAKWLELADWLKQAASEPTYERYISASAVITKLEQQLNISKGKLPALSKEDFKIAEKIQETELYYKKVIGDWLSWANENQRASFQFFEDYRQTWWKNDPLRQE